MSTEQNDVTQGNVAQQGKFSEEDLQRILKDRFDRENARHREELENQRKKSEDLQKRLEDMEKRFQQGKASTEEVQQLQAANNAAKNGVNANLTPEQIEGMVEYGMRRKEFTNNLQKAYTEDSEFKKLYDEGGANIPKELIEATNYLPNAVSVVKHLMKDQKSRDTYYVAAQEGGVQAMMFLNNISDKLSKTAEIPHESGYEPPKDLPDNSDESQSFDLKAYINKKW